MDTITQLRFPIAVNRKFVDKLTSRQAQFRTFNNTFENERLTMSELVTVITAGHAWTAPHHHVSHHRPRRHDPDYRTTYRVKANVIHSQLLALDADTEDEASSFATLLSDPLISQYAALIHATASSTPLRPRSRVIFILEEPLLPDAYEEAMRALLFRYPFCDQSVKQAAAVFYGASDCAYCFLRQILPRHILEEEILSPYRRHLTAAHARLEEERSQRRALVQKMGEKRPSSQVAAYVDYVYAELVHELSQLRSGAGLRHQRLFEIALQLASLRHAAWVSPAEAARLQTLEDDLFDAAVANGYVDDYGVDDAWRTIDNGVDTGSRLPYHEPLWLTSGEYFEIGEDVVAVVQGEVVASGRITQMRENGHWEFLLDTVPHTWFARNLLHRRLDTVQA